MSSNGNGCTKKSTEPHPFGLDDVLLKIGQFGKFQLSFLLLLFFLTLFHTIIKYGFMFSASTPVYRCRIAECDGSENSYDKPWTDFSIPKTVDGKLDKCQRYKTFNSTKDVQPFCNANNFDRKFNIDCGNDLIFRDKEVTISDDFKIFCSDEWKLAMVGTTNNLGQLIGIPLGGYFSDRCGRSTVLAWASILSAFIGISRSFSPNYYIFVIFGFLDNLFGSTIFGTCYVLALENLSPKVRAHASTLLPMCAGISRFLLALTAKYFLNWRLVERFFYIPALGFILFPWILPESFRWLLSKGEEDKAIQILQKAAKINSRKLSDASIKKLLEANRQILSGFETKNNKLPFGEAFKLFPWRIIICSLYWFTIIFIFFGLSLMSTFLGQNKFNSFMFLSLIEIPGTILPSFTINRYGRRYSLFGYMFLTGIFISAMTFLSSDSGNLQLTLYLLGKMTATAAFQIMYVFTSEIFPTNARNTLLSFCSMIGRLGSMVASQTTLIAKYYPSGPEILFASSAFISGSLVLFLPETKDIVLPTTFKDAEMIGNKKINVEPHTETEEKLLTSKA